ncbi:cysteine desulfurase family protein [Microbacterium kribbense]|uniref:Cysteine desulfurase family protein n=1 Tax=Microbacterium kribbense TaxID=433645 RepID=A0ABP7GF00_9MICO
MLYLDNAATTPVRPEVLAAMSPYLTRRFGNASSHHTVGEASAAALVDARSRVARVLGMRAGDVVFTSGGTEADNLAVKGIAVAAKLNRSAAHVVTLPIEHEAILESVAHLERVHGFTASQVPVDEHGRVEPTAIEAALRADTALVSIGYANNEVGTVQDVAAIAAVTQKHGIPLHIDAVQAAGWLPLSGTGADAISIAGHKIGAPKGTGALAVRGRIPIEPLLHGGGQQRGRRSGTEDVAGAVALATALELADVERAADAAAVSVLRDAFIRRVLASVPQARLTGHPVHRLPGTASFTFAGTSGEAVLLELERRGVISASGSACAAGSDAPSHVLVAMGIDPALAQTSVRFTLPHGWRQSLDATADLVAASVAAVTGWPAGGRQTPGVMSGGAIHKTPSATGTDGVRAPSAGA